MPEIFPRTSFFLRSSSLYFPDRKHSYEVYAVHVLGPHHCCVRQLGCVGWTFFIGSAMPHAACPSERWMRAVWATGRTSIPPVFETTSSNIERHAAVQKDECAQIRASHP